MAVVIKGALLLTMRPDRESPPCVGDIRFDEQGSESIVWPSHSSTSSRIVVTPPLSDSIATVIERRYRNRSERGVAPIVGNPKSAQSSIGRPS